MITTYLIQNCQNVLCIEGLAKTNNLKVRFGKSPRRFLWVELEKQLKIQSTQNLSKSPV